MYFHYTKIHLNNSINKKTIIISNQLFFHADMADLLTFPKISKIVWKNKTKENYWNFEKTRKKLIIASFLVEKYLKGNVSIDLTINSDSHSFVHNILFFK